MTLLLIFLTSVTLHIATSLPILSDDATKLNSIVISEINLPTEASLLPVADQEIAVEPASSFLDLVDKYEGMYGSVNVDEFTVQQKRSSTDDEDPNGSEKSLIDKIEILDPEVKKEFENELSQNQITRDEDEPSKNSHIATEYDPNYERKMIAAPQSDENVIEKKPHNESTTTMTVHDKENLQVHLVEQLIHHNENRHEVTTIVPESSFTNHTLVQNPQVVEVLEHIVYESDNELKMHEHTTLNPIHVVQIDVDPIEVIPKDRHREAKVETSTDTNDKFAGFVGIPTDDLIQPGYETTEPDNFFKKADTSDEDDADPVEVVRDTLEYVAIYGKSLKIDESTSATTEIPQTTTLEAVEESKTEIVEVNTKVTVNIQVGSEIESSSSEESGQQSVPSKSSEESNSEEDKKKTKKKVEGGESVSSEEIEAENVGKEDLSDEKLNLRSIEIHITQRPNALPVEEAFKDATTHEIKKKDHPDGLAQPYEVRQLTETTTEVATSRQLTDVTTQDDSSPLMETMTKVYEVFEEVATTVTDGIQLSKELKHQVESFRADSEENKIVLDTHSEAISSKNSKNPLVDVNDLEMMKLKERSFDNEPKLSVAIIPLMGVVSLVVLVTIFKIIKRKASSVRLD